MYLPTRSSAGDEEPAVALPVGMVKAPGSYIIPEGARVDIKEPLILPRGMGLRVGKGAVITMWPESSIKIQGDFIVEGSKEQRVSFVGRGGKGGRGGNGRPWNGIYAEGSSSEEIRVVLKEVDFADYGAFPKTMVGGHYLNGGITLYHADALISGARITGARGEDAINLIFSTARIEDTSISGAFSDGLDLDFWW